MEKRTINQISVQPSALRGRSLRLLLVVSLIVVFATTAVFLPVFAQTGGSVNAVEDCTVRRARPYPYPYPAYPAQGVSGGCAFLPVVVNPGR